MKMQNPVVRRAGMIALACGLALSVASCDRETETSRAVNDASARLTAMTGAGSSPAPVESRSAVYTKVAADIKAGAASGDGPEKAAANLILASAKAGLAAEPAAEAEEAEGNVLRLLSAVESSVSRWSVASSIAAAAESFDASAQITRVTAAKKEKDELKATQSERLTTLGTQLKDLRAKAAEKNTQADAKLAEHARLMGTTTQMTATQAEPIVERANAIRMQGERLRLDGGRYEAEADLIQPQFDEVNAVVAQLTKQRADLDATEADLAKQASEAKAEAAASRASASAIAGDIQRLIGEIEKMRNEDLASAYEKADRLLGESLAAAREAGKDPKSGGGRSAMGSANLAVAETNWRRSTGAQAYGRVLRSLAQVQPPLPGASEYKAMQEKVNTDRKASLEKATEALASARTAYDGVSAGAAVKERIETLSKLLEDAGKLANNERLDASSSLAPPAWLKGEQAAPGSSPKAALDAFLEMSRPVAEKIGKAEKACQEKFSKGLGDVLAAGGGMGAMLAPMLGNAAPGMKGVSPDAMAKVSADDFDWKVEGDKATATLAGMDAPLSFKKRGDTWSMDLPEMAGMPMSQEMISQMMTPFLSALDQWTAEIESGTYPDEAAASKGLMSKFGGFGGG